MVLSQAAVLWASQVIVQAMKPCLKLAILLSQLSSARSIGIYFGQYFDHGATYGKSESPCAVFSPTVQITLPHSMHMRDSDGNTYVAEQMHFHWGGRDSEISGSEHTFDGMRKMMEVCDNPTGLQTHLSLCQCLYACVTQVLYMYTCK